MWTPGPRQPARRAVETARCVVVRQHAALGFSRWREHQHTKSEHRTNQPRCRRCARNSRAVQHVLIPPHCRRPPYSPRLPVKDDLLEATPFALTHCRAFLVLCNPCEPGLGRPLSASDAPGADEPTPVVRAAEPDDLHSPSGTRRVHHASSSQVDADVPEPPEEDEVARLHPGARHSPAHSIERVRAVWELDAQSSVRPVDEPRAVETTGGGASSPDIRNADRLERDPGSAFAHGSSRSRSLPRMAGPRRVDRRGRTLHATQHTRVSADRTGAAEQARGECERKQQVAGAAWHKEEKRRRAAKRARAQPWPVRDRRTLAGKQTLSTPICAHPCQPPRQPAP